MPRCSTSTIPDARADYNTVPDGNSIKFTNLKKKRKK
jgi:hypothetical protein